MSIKEVERFSGIVTVKVGISDVVKKADQLIDKVVAHLNSLK